MQKEIIVNSTPYEVRIAILEDKELVELLIERAETKRIVGDIYKGVVTAVLPGIQAAFVDIGAEKAAFLHVSDLVDPRDEEDDPPEARRGNHSNGRPLPAIQDVLQKGEEILVQVTKEPIATKGPRITTQISLPGRFAVIMPNADHTGVSRKIEDRGERQRLKTLVDQLKPSDCGLIVRTVGEGVEQRALENDVAHLESQWKRIQEKAAPAVAPSLIHQDVGLVIGLVRDVFNEDVDQLVLDNRKAFEQLTDYLRDFAPDMLNRIKLYSDPMPIYDKYGIENEIDKTLDRKVWLKKGGYIIIEQTEALVSVDVNTGRFTGKKNQEETIFKTNVLAAREIARQLRLRDIGGIIVIDFIDMESEANKKKVLTELRAALKRDRAKTKAFQVSDLGLIEMSRQRVRPSLYHFMSDQCSYCESTGHVLSLDSVANRVQRMVRRVGHYTRARELRLLANPRLTLFLREERADRLSELMDLTGVRIDLIDDPRLHREDFRLLSVDSGDDLMRRIGSLRGPRTETVRATDPTPPARRRGGRGRRGGLSTERGSPGDGAGRARGAHRGAGREGTSRGASKPRGGSTPRREVQTPGDGRDGRRRRRGSRGRGRRGRPILEDNPNLSAGTAAGANNPTPGSDEPTS
jgi:ribonuclease G